VELGGGKKPSRDCVPVVGGGEGKILFAIEMVEKAAFRQSGSLTNVLYPCRAISFGSNYTKRRV
jgi:hypothetical protein